MENKVFLTSPKNFEIVCQFIILIIKRQEIAQNARLIINSLSQLGKDLEGLKKLSETAYDHIRNGYNKFDEFRKNLKVSFCLRIKFKNFEIPSSV